MPALDPRLHAYRSDLADLALKGKVETKIFVQGRRAQVIVPVTALYQKADETGERASECLLGEELCVFDDTGDYCWVQSHKDHYVGYIKRHAFVYHIEKPTHWLTVSRSFQYQEPDLRSQMVAPLSLGAKFCVMEKIETRGTHYYKLENGHYIIAHHCKSINEKTSDYVDVALKLLHTPYLWGGVSGFGIDCSGLLQLSMMMAGKSVLRDTDMQKETIGHYLDKEQDLQRGDLVFWQGHVAIMLDDKKIIHANGASMDVSIETLEAAKNRIAGLYGLPIAYKRV
ncbi:NlpC/P60 family protein [Bartonella tamiae]|uniref:NlpC/P60 domain-containing protein n=1 Tax=Bartonella tamiae Th239 TaxID=1094558 RepID=J0QYA4_9HYPH|nr:NlpC/P60 family protein [Bartonella tamiae]EJF91081.1 hypothetical protein ME5_00413 [Bartonella tamiae Th239]EJF93254.1 hypothetical protein MEG_01468 [Bartonella tamiae Th307]